MTKHTVTLSELNDWMALHTAAFASEAGSGKYKSLLVKLAGGYRVSLNGVAVYEGTNAVEAIATYNDL
jgi:hypothetical protein